MEEKDLTEKQKRWLEASRRIGPGPMTKTERQTLEKLYADMLPAEQQELAKYINEKFGKKESKSNASQPQAAQPEKQDPIERMQKRIWSEPSDALKTAFSKVQVKARPISNK